MTVYFDVIGLPAPQGSKTRMPSGAVIEGASTSGRVAHKAWRQAVSERAREIAEEHGSITGPTHLTLMLRFPRPKTRNKSHHGWHVVRPDKDKVLRACLDALKDGGLIHDDAQVCHITLSAIEVTGWTGAQFAIGEAP